MRSATDTFVIYGLLPDCKLSLPHCTRLRFICPAFGVSFLIIPGLREAQNPESSFAQRANQLFNHRVRRSVPPKKPMHRKKAFHHGLARMITDQAPKSVLIRVHPW